MAQRAVIKIHMQPTFHVEFNSIWKLAGSATKHILVHHSYVGELDVDMAIARISVESLAKVSHRGWAK